MSDTWTKAVVLGLLAVVVGVPFVLRPEDAAEAARAGGGVVEKLVIITPHNEQIRFEVSRAFNAWRVAGGKAPIEFDWRSGGGTSDLRDQVMNELQKAASAGREDDGLGYDLFFGGGDVDHNTLATGPEVERDGKKVKVPVTVPITLPPGLLEEAFPGEMIGSNRLYHPERRWVGVVLSAFGIVYNRDVVAMLQLPEPTTWEDLADPRYAGWVALADPSHSGSISATYNAAVRRLGWTEGWATLRRVYANARYFTSSAAKVPIDVSSGEAAAGMCIDFYGRYQAGAVARGRVGYIDPAKMSTINADPISLMRGAPGAALAQEFVAWLLSKEAQRLWQLPVGEPGGPRQYELRRMPIRRDLYTDAERARWVDGVNPFELAAPFPKAVPDYFRLIAPITKAMAIDLHEELSAAWAALSALPEGDPRRAEALALFDAMPPDLTLQWPDPELAEHWPAIVADPTHPRHGEAAKVLKAFTDERVAWVRNPDKKLELRLQWSAFFRANYRRIVALAAE